MFEGALEVMAGKVVPNPLAADRAKAFGLTPVSRETAERLDRFVALLLAWQRTTNLIAASTVPCLWTRHIADSLQLMDLAPAARMRATRPRSRLLDGGVRASVRPAHRAEG